MYKDPTVRRKHKASPTGWRRDLEDNEEHHQKGADVHQQLPEKYLPGPITISNANQLLAEEETWWGWMAYALVHHHRTSTAEAPWEEDVRETEKHLENRP